MHTVELDLATPLDHSRSQDSDDIVNRLDASVRISAEGPWNIVRVVVCGPENGSSSCGSRRHEQGGIQADLRQAPDRAREMYYSVRFLDNIGNFKLKSILRIKSLST